MINIKIGDSRDILKTMPSNSIQCVVTSPPYFNLRDYKVKNQIGLEGTPEEYVVELVKVFEEVKRVLRPDGTVWLNLGDTYIKKRLLGIPWRVAFALQEAGWYLRQDIIYNKLNPMPESIKDRCTKSHEYIFLLSKSPVYYFDSDAIKEPANYPYDNRGSRTDSRRGTECNSMSGKTGEYRHKRDVWTLASQPYKGAHFATFPPKLIEPCILAGTPKTGVCSRCGAPMIRAVTRTRYPTRPGNNTKIAGTTPAEHGNRDPAPHITETATTGWVYQCLCNASPRPAAVLDPFAGSGTVGEVCNRLGRDAVLIELNPNYEALIRQRCGMI